MAELPPLLESDVDPNPLLQFDRWYAFAASHPIVHHNALTLATATRDGIPSARVVLLKGRDAKGFTFFTNYESNKARELAENPRAAMVFFWSFPNGGDPAWPTLDRQIRVIGTVAKTSREDSEEYFRTRPRGSQIGAWASRQSRALASRAELDERVAQISNEYEGKDVPCPPHWGGYRLTPTSFEFWQSRVSRLHDRLRYTRRADGSWRIERLAP